MRKVWQLFFAFVVILFTASTSMATSYSVFIGGKTDTENQGYLYTGIIVEEPVRQNLSIMGKFVVDYLTYKFETGSEIIKAKAPAFQPAIGVKFSGQDWSTTFWAGWEHRNTKIKPFREDVEVRGTTDSLVLQAELDRWIKAMTNLNFIVSYSTKNSYIWSRGRLKQELSSYPLGRDLPLRVGLEVIGQRDKDYSAFQVGPLVEIYSPSKKISFLIHGGYKNSSGVPNSAYGGIELSFGF